jgi:hypothetical protein
VLATEITGLFKKSTQAAFVGMKTTEQHLRAWMAFTELDKLLRELPFEDSGYATPKEYIDDIVMRVSATAEGANGRYSLYDLAPFVKDIAGNWLGHNALLLMKPAVQASLNWVQLARKTGMELKLADTPTEKRKIILGNMGRLSAAVAQMTLVGGVRAVPLMTEALALMAGYDIAVNDGEWTATQQTALEKLELGVREVLTEAGVPEEHQDTLKKVMYYGAFSTLVGVNLSMNESWAGYFDPITLKQMKTLYEGIGKAGKSGDFIEDMGMLMYKTFAPTQLKRTILGAMELANDKRYGNNLEELPGELTTKELVKDFIFGKTLNEVDDQDAVYKLLNATDTDAGKQDYLEKLIKAPNIKIDNAGYLADFTDKSITMQPELLRRTKLLQLAAYKADKDITPYQTTSRHEVQAWIDEDLAKGKDSELRAWAEYGDIPSEVKGGTLQQKIDRVLKWSDEYYQSEISIALLQNEAQRGNIIFKDKAISPSAITLDVPDEVKNAPDALKGFEYFKHKLKTSTDKVKRGGTTKEKKKGGRVKFDSDGELIIPETDTKIKEYNPE